MTNTVDFGDVITAMVTPFKADKKPSEKEPPVDLDEMELLANYLLKHGTDMLLLTGSTGEAAQLSADEKWAIVSRLRCFTPKGAKIMVATSDTNTQRAIHKTNKAFEFEADAVLVAVPEYIKPPQRALFMHFNAIAKSAGNKPIVIYNIPGRTGTEILPETVADLAFENPNIVGIKQSMGNMDKVSELRTMCPEGFKIYSGDDSLTLPMLALGASGVISVTSHLEGDLMRKMVREFKANHTQKALEIHNLLYPLYKALFMATNPLPIKEALYQKGLISSPTLRTLGEMSKEDKEKLRVSLYNFEQRKNLYMAGAPLPRRRPQNAKD